MGWDQSIASKLRAAGLNVVEVAGWQTRGSASFNPRGFVRHHTAGPAAGNAPSLNICIYGRSGLPGPLCNVFQARDNTIYVVAAGRANHAGAGSWRGLSGNSSVYGIEVENTGTGSEPWREDQLETTARVCAALMPNIEMNCEHKEWAPRRKPDRFAVDGNVERERMKKYLGGGGPVAPPVDLVAIANAIKEARTHTLREGDKGDAVKWLQAGINNLSGRGLVVDGDFGPATAQAVRDLQKFVGLPVTGVADSAVWSLLYDKQTQAPPADTQAGFKDLLESLAASARGKQTLRRGDRGPAVADLQQHLTDNGFRTGVDGVFGRGTEATLKNYQRSRNLGADGVAGYNTWLALLADALKRSAR